MTDVTNNNAASTQDTAAQPALQPATDGANSGSSNGAKTFTQEQVNELVGNTRKSARDTAIADMLKELGLTSKDDIKTLKATIEADRQRKEADMTDAQKAQAELQKVTQRYTELEAQLNAERTQRRNDLIASKVIAEATKMKANDTDDVLRYARDKHGDALNALMNDSGVIDEKQVTTLLEKIKAEKAHYFTPVIPGAGSPSNAGGRAMTEPRISDTERQRWQRGIKM